MKSRGARSKTTTWVQGCWCRMACSFAQALAAAMRSMPTERPITLNFKLIVIAREPNSPYAPLQSRTNLNICTQETLAVATLKLRPCKACKSRYAACKAFNLLLPLTAVSCSGAIQIQMQRQRRRERDTEAKLDSCLGV